jgi:signal transduction histidine kinase
MNIGSTEAASFDSIDISLAQVFAKMVEAALVSADRERELRSQREALQRQNQRLEKFANIVSHDLRNPLNVASGRLELARTERDSAYLEDIAHAHDRMEALIDDVLALSKAGNQVSELDTVDLETVSESCWRNVQTVDATLVTATNRTILADRSPLQQLLENLMRNAVEHGGDDVTITVGDLGDTGFYVADDGPGVATDGREKIFESGHSTSEGGTGLGLAIVKEIADAHDWEISVTDSDAGGARFEITGVRIE